MEQFEVTREEYLEYINRLILHQVDMIDSSNKEANILKFYTKYGNELCARGYKLGESEKYFIYEPNFPRTRQVENNV